MKIPDNMRDEIREMYYEPLKNNKILKHRLHEEESTRSRNDFQRDYTRVIYSSSFRRLQGKMQLLGLQNDKFFRNRLTHSFEVAQIAREIAENMGYSQNDIYVVETCALAHDMGNPPFGHFGEKILNTLSKDIGGFEGNAQTLRVLMDLEKKHHSYRGLNLTLRTLLGVTKYFSKFDGEKNKFIYSDTYEILQRKIEESGIKVRTLDVQIVDLADEIAYAAHDVEDALSLKLFTIDELLYEFKLKNTKYPEAYDALREIVEGQDGVKAFAMEANIYQSSEEFSFLLRKELTGKIIYTLINDIRLGNVDEKHKVKTGTQWEKELRFNKYETLSKGLKDITFGCINRTDKVYVYEQQGEKIIKGLFEVFMNYSQYLPVEYRHREDDCPERKTRHVIDYIAGMMDSFAISAYERFYSKIGLEDVFNK